MSIHWGLAFWTVVTFLVLLVVLKRFAWKPLLSSLDAREKSIRDAIEQAEKSRQEAQKTLQDAQEKLAKSGQEARAMLDNAQAQTARLREQMMAETERECTQLKTQVQLQISQARDKAIQEIWSQMATISTELAGKLLHRSLRSEDHSQFFAESLADMRKRIQS